MKKIIIMFLFLILLIASASALNITSVADDTEGANYGETVTFTGAWLNSNSVALFVTTATDFDHCKQNATGYSYSHSLASTATKTTQTSINVTNLANAYDADITSYASINSSGVVAIKAVWNQVAYTNNARLQVDYNISGGSIVVTCLNATGWEQELSSTTNSSDGKTQTNITLGQNCITGTTISVNITLTDTDTEFGDRPDMLFDFRLHSNVTTVETVTSGCDMCYSSWDSSSPTSCTYTALDETKAYVWYAQICDSNSTCVSTNISGSQLTGSFSVTQRTGSGGGGSTVDSNCYPQWSCEDWGICKEGNFQNRICTDAHNCGVAAGMPATSQACNYVPVKTTSAPQNIPISEDTKNIIILGVLIGVVLISSVGLVIVLLSFSSSKRRRKRR